MYGGSRNMNGRIGNERQALTEGLRCKCSVGLAFSRDGITIPILQMWILRPMEITLQASIVSNRACLWAQIYLNLGSSHQAVWKHRTHHFPSSSPHNSWFLAMMRPTKARTGLREVGNSLGWGWGMGEERAWSELHILGQYPTPHLHPLPPVHSSSLLRASLPSFLPTSIHHSPSSLRHLLKV